MSAKFKRKRAILFLFLFLSPAFLAACGDDGEALAPPADIAAGDNHTCALLTGGTVVCWGNNSSGQLGIGTTASFPFPVGAVGITTAADIVAGDSHTCVLLSNGTIRCWGRNFEGQLGNGAFFDFSPTPVTVSGISTATAISAGEFHTCAVLASGAMQCWGDNSSDELGIAKTTTIKSSLPLSVSGISMATGLATGDFHTCALLSDNTIKCWGSNASGQLGDGTNNDSFAPVTVTGISSATSISAGASHSCARLSNGKLHCWGDNDFGQLGDGLTADSSTPKVVSGISTASGVSAGDFHTCTFLSDLTIRCWGSNDSGQLGITNATPISEFPTPGTGISTATEIALGGIHSCALLSNSRIKCWGANASGQLGNGGTTDSFVPMFVVGF